MVDVLKRQIAMCRKKENMRPRAEEKESVLHRIYTTFVETTEDRVCQRVLRTSAVRVFWNEDLPDLPRSSVRILQIFLDKTVKSKRGSVLVAYPVRVLLLNFSKEYSKRVIQN